MSYRQQTLADVTADATETKQRPETTTTTTADSNDESGGERPRVATQGLAHALAILPPRDWQTDARRALRLQREGLL